ncbi:hypothetical protein GQ53DRAFT_862345, partial [Thozetella sp. PMI_491]
LEQLAKNDLKSFSLVSKYGYQVASKALWKSITITPHRITAVEPPQACLRLATQLHFSTTFLIWGSLRCPHGYSEDWCEAENSGGEGGRDNEEEGSLSYFDRLVERAKSLLEQLDDGQLHSFSWDLGTCLTSELIGSHGVLSRSQKSLQTLSLTTDIGCENHDDPQSKINLSAFRQLQSLRWRAPSTQHLGTLADAIRKNATKLQKLELDFISWSDMRDYWGDVSDDEDERYESDGEKSYFTAKMLRLKPAPSPPLFPNLRALSLSQVPLGAAMARAVDLGALKSLTLRQCLDWDTFISAILKLDCPIRLRRFEIQDAPDMSETGDRILRDFLDAFQGLEHIFICQPASDDDTLHLWESVRRHQATLKQFMYHQRAMNMDSQSIHFEQEMDQPDLGIGIEGIEDYFYDEDNPLWGLNLESIGLACFPNYLKTLLCIFTPRTSLKVLHIRQSRSDIGHTGSWGILETSSGRDGPPLSSLSGRPIDEIDSGSIKYPLNMLRIGFLRFLEWVFGPRGVPSLQVVAFGDFAYGGRGTQNVMATRSPERPVHFRLVDESMPEWKEILSENSELFEACPNEPLLGFGPD